MMPACRALTLTLSLALVLLAGTLAPAHAVRFTLPRAAFLSPRPLGMGGAFTAISNDRNLFFTNPAGLAHVDGPRFGFDVVPLIINNNTLRAIDFVSDNIDRFEDLENLSQAEQAAFYDDVLREIGGERSEVSAHVPLYVLLPAPEGVRRPSLGFGFFAGARSDFLTQNGASGIPIAFFDLDVQYTGIATAAWSWDTLLPGRLSAGGSIKIDHRRLSRNAKSLLALSADEELDILSATSIGFDLGATYEVSPRLRVGAALFDIAASDFTFEGQDRADPTDTLNDGDVGEVETALVIGGAFHLDVPIGPLDDVTVALDLHEPFDGDRAFWKSIYMGAESQVLFFTARFGFYEGYPGAGFGLGPLQYAYYSNEVGRFPGARSNYAHAVSLAFGFGL